MDKLQASNVKASKSSANSPRKNARESKYVGTARQRGSNVTRYDRPPLDHGIQGKHSNDSGNTKKAAENLSKLSGQNNETENQVLNIIKNQTDDPVGSSTETASIPDEKDDPSDEVEQSNLLTMSQSDLSKTFLQHCGNMLTNVPSRLHNIWVAILFKILYDQLQNGAPEPFHTFSNTTHTLERPMKLKEAVLKSLPDVMNICRFLMTWISLCILIKRSFSKTPIVIMVILAPVYYFTTLLAMAPKIRVNCGSFQMPLIGFEVLEAVGITLLIIIVLIWKYMHR